MCHQCRVDLKTDGLGPVSFGRCNHDSSISRSKIIEKVSMADLSQLQHPVDHFLGCGHKRSDIRRVAVLFFRISDANRIIALGVEFPADDSTNQKHNGKIRKESEHAYFNSISLLKNSMAVWPTWSGS